MPNLKLTKAEKELLADFEREAQPLQQQVNGALRLMLKTRGLTGTWKIENGEFVEQK